MTSQIFDTLNNMNTMKISRMRAVGLALCLVGLGVLGDIGVWAFVPINGAGHAPRWSNLPGTLVDSGQWGLGGGLEYAIDADFCGRMRAAFVDNPAPACGLIKQTIQRAFDEWSAGHPVLAFVDVSQEVVPDLKGFGTLGTRDFSVVDRENKRLGAEIDLFAFDTNDPRHLVDPSELGSVLAYAQLYWDDAAPLGTNERFMTGSVTTVNADIVFNADNCFYMRITNKTPGCFKFENVLLHEIGHVLGLDHPDEHPEDNLDDDNDPFNRIQIDCQAPRKGLSTSSKLDPKSIMSAFVETRDIDARITNDDLGGRDFLYPFCSQDDEDDPDSDGDGVPDSEDFCPDFRGRKEANGC